MNEWTVRYENDVGTDDETYFVWYVITGPTGREFKADTEEDAMWLAGILSKGDFV